MNHEKFKKVSELGQKVFYGIETCIFYFVAKPIGGNSQKLHLLLHLVYFLYGRKEVLLKAVLHLGEKETLKSLDDT